MSNLKELYRVVSSSDFTENISIPLSFATPCKSFSLYNGSDTVTITITVKGKAIPIPPDCASGEIRFERDWFSNITIDASDLGHNFILELYRD